MTNDGATIGPGQYNVAKSIKAVAQSPRGAIKWSNSKSTRQDHFTKSYTSAEVGPGKYSTKGIDRSIQNPTIPRAMEQRRQPNSSQVRKQSIPNDFEDETDERQVTLPGPGAYLQNF